MQKTKSLPYQEGSCFAVPLRKRGYALGVVARLSGDGGVFGYFFGPKRESIPTLSDFESLSVGDSIWQRRFGDLGFLNREWPIIGKVKKWRREEWPLLSFINIDDISGKAVKVTLSDNDLSFVSQEPCDPALAEHFPADADSGYGAVEIWLTKLLA